MLPARLALVGCDGFVGSHLLSSLLALGVEVDGWDLQCERIQGYLEHPHFHFHQADIADAQVVEQIAAIPVVIHLAALCTPGLYNTQDWRVIQSNYLWPIQLAQACAKQGSWLVYFSSSEVYGRTLRGALGLAGESLSENLDLLTEDQSPLLLGPVQARRWSYASAKILMERSLVGLAAEHSLKWTVVRPFNFIGAGMDYLPGIDGDGIPRVLACFMDALKNQQPISLVNGGQARRCFTAIEDAVGALLLLLENQESAQGQCFNIGNPNNEVRIFELAQMLLEIAQEQNLALAKPAHQNISAQEFYGEGYQDSDRRLPDISKMQNLGWMPKIDLRTALNNCLIWYRKHYAF